MNASTAFLASLDADQLATVQFDLSEANRGDWSNLPVPSVPRDGLQLAEMTESQQALAYAVLDASLSTAGYTQARDIIALDQWGYENGDPLLGEQYYTWAFYGTPSLTDPWAWQLDGHHLVYNFTVLCDAVVMAPNLLGAYPTTVPDDGSTVAGLRALEDEMDLALDLMFSMTPDQIAVAVASDTDGLPLLAGPGVNGVFPAPEGIAAVDLDATQRTMLLALLEAWASDQDEAYLPARMAEIEANLDDTWIVWDGPIIPERQWYYRVQGPTVYVEFDHTAVDHVHAVYRNPLDDYGEDLLAEHLARFH